MCKTKLYMFHIHNVCFASFCFLNMYAFSVFCIHISTIFEYMLSCSQQIRFGVVIGGVFDGVFVVDVAIFQILRRGRCRFGDYSIVRKAYGNTEW